MRTSVQTGETVHSPNNTWPTSTACGQTDTPGVELGRRWGWRARARRANRVTSESRFATSPEITWLSARPVRLRRI